MANAILTVAEKNETKVTNAFLKTVEIISKRLRELIKQYEDDFISGDTIAYKAGEIASKVVEGTGIRSDSMGLWESLQDVITAGADVTIEALESVSVEKASVGVEMQFDLLNPYTIKFLQSYKFDLIQNINTTTREAIRQIVKDGAQRGFGTDVIARDIRALIGLTPNLAQAALNYQASLESGSLGALERDLRDRRFDSTVRSAVQSNKKLTKVRIKAMVDAYKRRALNYRARMIARTETSRAAVIGQNMAWRQARDQNLLPRGMRRFWVVVNNCCDECRAIARNHSDGVTLDAPFHSNIGTIDGPPLHPHCRCAVVLRLVKT